MTSRFPGALLCLALLCLAGGRSFAAGFDTPFSSTGTPQLRFALPHLRPSELGMILEGQGLILDAKGEEGFRFLPEAPEALSLKDYALKKKSDLLIGSALLVPGVDVGQDGLLALVNKLLETGTLSGITYYSETRKKVTVLFDDVFRVYEPGSRTRLPDYSFAQLPASLVMTVHINDVNFGTTWYSLRMERRGQGLLVSLKNDKALSYYLFTAFGAGKLEMLFLLLPVKEGILINGLCVGNPSKAIYTFVDVYSAIEKRMRAVQGWIARRAAEMPGSGR